MKHPLTKRLAAIMFTDMAGFTALMQQDEKTGLKKRARHRQVFEEQHSRFNGEIIQYFGDGTLSIFSNSCDAVECAIHIQKALKKPLEVPLRIGIHAGNILMGKDDIIGDAVNIASRIESFGNVGGVLISDVVYEQIKNQTQWGYLSLGTFCLKNVERPFQIYAVVTDGITVPNPDFLQGKGEKNTLFPVHLPVPAAPMLGREKELNEVVELLNNHRVVTITGTGGLGKTRLVLEICHHLKPQYHDGVGFISMATLKDASEFMPVLASALDVKFDCDRPLIDIVAAVIADKKTLLALDNLEQIIATSREIAQLVALCPNLNIICTSRTPLNIKAEQEYALHPLPMPNTATLEGLSQNAAVELFVTRVRQTSMDFALTEDNAEAVLEICRHLDGLPLAIELAAARIRMMSPDMLLRRLNRTLDVLTSGASDAPERHQTLRSTIDWSFNMLNGPEQQLFRRLAVFTGNFSLEAVESVCYGNPEEALVALDTMESLLNKALVEKVENTRQFRMLETIRDFALEKLEMAGETDLFSLKHEQFFGETDMHVCKPARFRHTPNNLTNGEKDPENPFRRLNFFA